jgi:hypothetical protein
MKEKLLGLLGPARGRLESLWARLAGRWRAVVRSPRKIAMLVGGLLLPALIPMGVLAYWFYTHPAEDLRPVLIARISRLSGSASVELGHIEWKHSLAPLELGVAVSDLEIREAGHFGVARFPEARVALSIAGLFGPNELFRFRAGDARIEIAGRRDAGIATQVGKAVEAKSPTWLPSGGGVKLSLENATLVLGEQKEIHKLQVEIDVDGLLGGVEAKVEGDFAVQAESWTLVGPFEVELEGSTRKLDGVLDAVEIDDAKVHLDAASFEGFGFMEKGPQIPLLLEVREGSIDFSDQNGHAVFEGIDLREGRLHFDEIGMDVSAYWDENGSSRYSWTLGKTEVKALHFPFKILRKAESQGVVDSHGRLEFGPESDDTKGNWRLAFNNVRWDAAHIAAALGQPRHASSGLIRASFVTEGGIRAGRIVSPRTEIQFDATESQVDFFDGAFVKPRDDGARLLVRAEIGDDTLRVGSFKLDLHTLSASGDASFKGFRDWISGRNRSAFEAKLFTNNVDLSRWNAYFPFFNRVPLQGYLHLAASLNSEVSLKDEALFPSPISWNVERLNLSNFKGSIERSGYFSEKDLPEDSLHLSGPLAGNLLFRGRGDDWKVNRGDLLAQLDLNDASFIVGSRFRKPEKIPFQLEVSLEQARNSVEVKRGLMRLHELELNFTGGIVQGSARNRLQVAMLKPVRLENWDGFFLGLPRDFPLKGELQWRGDIGFAQAESMDAALDWSKLSVAGQFGFKDLSFPIPLFGKRLSGANGSVLLQPSLITIPDLRFNTGDSEVSLAGSIRRRSGKGENGFYLSDWFSPKPVEIDASLTLSKFDPLNFVPHGDGLLARFLKSDIAPESRVTLSVNADSGEWNDLALSNLLARFEWDRGQLRVRPFSVKAMGGAVSGSWNSDFRPVYQRKDPVLHSANFELRDLSVPLFLGFVNGQDWGFTGSGRMTGLFTGSASSKPGASEFSDLRGRFKGLMKGGGHVASTALKGMLGEFFRQTPGADYLLKDAKLEACIDPSFDADFDLQLVDGGLNVEQSEFRYPSGTRVFWSARIGEGGSFKTQAAFTPGPSCVKGDARECLLKLAPRGRIPFAAGGSTKLLDLHMESKEWSRSLASCVAGRIESRVKASAAGAGAAQ